jgi:hypothetical protein
MFLAFFAFRAPSNGSITERMKKVRGFELRFLYATVLMLNHFHLLLEV